MVLQMLLPPHTRRRPPSPEPPGRDHCSPGRCQEPTEAIPHPSQTL